MILSFAATLLVNPRTGPVFVILPFSREEKTAADFDRSIAIG